MISPARSGRSRALLAVPALGIALALTSCAGGSGGTPATSSGTAAAGAPSGASGMPGGTGMSGGSMPGTAGASSMPAMTGAPAVTPGPAATGAHNAADVAFATAMIGHHGQAVMMSDLLLARSTDARARALAESIRRAQTPEISAMAGWLKGWGARVPDPYATMADGMAGMGGNGMMSNAQMGQLAAAKGTSADRVFLTLMPEHHQGAIDMARTELARGVNPEAKQLARSIITSQSAQITQMRAMLRSLPQS